MSGVAPGAVLEREDTRLVREIVTPEGVPIRFTLASGGDRAAAFVIDMLIQVGMVIAIIIVFSLGFGGSKDAQGSWLTPVIIIFAFLISNFYFAFFEARWQGSTPGKRKVGIRVIDARGGQLETGAILARNLVRELEIWTPVRFLAAQHLMWPNAPWWAVILAGVWTFVFLFLPLFNKDRLRVGDLIAGTRVVLQPKTVLLPDLVDETAAVLARPFYQFTPEQLGVYGIYELQVLEGVLRTDARQIAHHEAVNTVTERIKWKIKYPTPVGDPERFLREFYAALRAHLEQQMLFGHRREDKFAKQTPGRGGPP